MKQLSILALSLVLLTTAITAQTTSKALERNAAFTGATTTKKMYHAIYQLDVNDPKIIEKAIRNYIINAHKLVTCKEYY